MMKRRAGAKTLWQLFSGMLTISAFTFGGGFVIVTLMKKRYVDELALISEEEMLDYTAMAQTMPGPIAVNAAILLGWRAAGLPGMLAAVLGTIVPPFVIISLISLAYAAFSQSAVVRIAMRGMQAGVAAVLADVVCSLGGKVIKSRSAVNIVVMIAAFIAAMFMDVHVILIILGAALAGLAASLIARAKEGTR